MEIKNLEMRNTKYNIKELKKNYLKGKKQKFLFFWGHQPSKDGSITKTCFSQWWKSVFIENGRKYCCMEQYMMAKKAELFEDNEILEEIMETADPKKIKALGRKVKNFDEKKWNETKYSIVFVGNLLKFSQDENLKDFLISTKNDIIVEASPYDKIWGIGMSADDEFVENPTRWKGENLLGFALMEVRDELSK